MENHGHGSYIAGFVLAVVLTAIPFYLVFTHSLSPVNTMYVIAVTAVLQILVHLRFFLHLNFTTTPRENLLAVDADLGRRRSVEQVVRRHGALARGANAAA